MLVMRIFKSFSRGGLERVLKMGSKCYQIRTNVLKGVFNNFVKIGCGGEA